METQGFRGHLAERFKPVKDKAILAVGAAGIIAAVACGGGEKIEPNISVVASSGEPTPTMQASENNISESSDGAQINKGTEIDKNADLNAQASDPLVFVNSSLSSELKLSTLGNITSKENQGYTLFEAKDINLKGTPLYLSRAEADGKLRAQSLVVDIVVNGKEGLNAVDFVVNEYFNKEGSQDIKWSAGEIKNAQDKATTTMEIILVDNPDVLKGMGFYLIPVDGGTRVYGGPCMRTYMDPLFSKKSCLS